MLAYVFWHRPAAGIGEGEYERALGRFHRSLARRPPSGFRGSVALRAPALPWLPAREGSPDAGYEDWYVLDDWSSVGVLEAAAISRAHAGAHELAARHAGACAGGVYRLLDGEGSPRDAHLAIWVDTMGRSSDPAIADLLEDGMQPRASSLWRRCLVLGPAPQLCLLSADRAIEPQTGPAPARVPPRWTLQAAAREPVVADA
jgi:hypothetical protein